MLNVQLDLAKSLAPEEQRPSIGQGYTTSPIHKAYESLRNTAPKIDCQTVSWANHVIRANREIHGNHVGPIDRIAKHIEAKTFRRTLPGCNLHIHVKQRRHICVRIRLPHHVDRTPPVFQLDEPATSRV